MSYKGPGRWPGSDDSQYTDNQSDTNNQPDAEEESSVEEESNAPSKRNVSFAVKPKVKYFTDSGDQTASEASGTSQLVVAIPTA
nr:hypothetical protein L203_04610 [Cryptococcus depauperatus CBS 7841]